VYATPETVPEAWRRDAAKKIVTYDEAQVDYGLESADEGPMEEEVTSGHEIDLVLSHSRDEDHLADEQDIPQVNLVSDGDRFYLTTALPHQMERLFPHPQHRRAISVSQDLQRV
jgi:hypothetical protein